MKSWSDPFWDAKTGEVMAHERATLYGIGIYSGRKTRFAPKDPDEARRLFIQRALVEGDLFGASDLLAIQKQSGSIYKFFWHNQQLIKQIESLEHKSRRQDVLVDDELLYAFYDSKLPHEVNSRAALEAWLKEDEKQVITLNLDKADLMRHEAAGVTMDRYPKELIVAGSSCALSYHFEPGSPKDGVTLTLPLTLLNQLDARRCEWLVPGLCVEKIHLYLKSLPQKLRRHCVPLPEYSKQFVERMIDADRFGQGDLVEALIADIRVQTQVQIQKSDFRPENLPTHCFMNIRLVDEHGRQLELERNLAQLRSQYTKVARELFAEVASKAVSEAVTKPLVNSGSENVVNQVVTSESIKDWAFGVLPEMLEIKRGRQTLFGYPALVDCETHCEIEVFDDPGIARNVHLLGLRRLFAIPMRDTIKALHKQLPGAREIGLLFMQIGNAEELLEQIINLSIDRACLNEPLPTNAEEFKARLASGKPKLALIAQEVGRHVLASLTAYAELQKKVASLKVISSAAHTDVQSQLQKLIYPQFVAKTPYTQLVHLPRYLKGVALRIDKLRANPARDAQCQSEWQSLATPWERMVSAQRGGGNVIDPRLEDFRWQLEELRVALFAQELKTPTPMSVKRLQKILESLRA